MSLAVPGCSAAINTSGILTLACDLPPEPDEAPGCHPVYMGNLWVERDPNSTAAYDLAGLGWLRNSCRGGHLYSVAEQTKHQLDQKSGKAMRALLDACKPPPTPK